jgi:hypothetical protein
MSNLALQDVYRVSMGSPSPLDAKLVVPLASNRAGSSGSFPFVACTTRGHLRFWRSIADGIKFNEERVPGLREEESCTVLTATPDDSVFILVTSHLRVFMVSLYDEYKLQVTELKKPEAFSGFLGFFSGNRPKTQHTIKRVIVTPRYDGRCNLVILSNQSLQWWVLSGFAGNHVCLFDKPITPELEKQNSNVPAHSDLEIEPVDVQVSTISPSRGDRDVLGLYLLSAERILVSAQPESVALALTYRLWGLELVAPSHAISGTSNPAATFSAQLQQVTSKQTLAYQPQYDSQSYNYFVDETRFILPSESRAGYVLNKQDIIFTRVPVDERPLDYERLDPVNVSIIGSGEMEKYGLIMLAPHGIARMMQPGVDMSYDNKYSAMDVDTYGTEATQNLDALLARAFKLFGTNDLSYRAIADSLRRNDLNQVIPKFGESIIDAPPAGDPRWAEDPQQQNSYQHSLALISQHLEDKKRRYTSFLLFLAKSELMSCLNRASLAALSEYREKVAAACQLRNIQSSSEIWVEVSNAIKDVLEQRSVNIEEWQQSGFGPQDVFFSKVSRIEEILFRAQIRQNITLSSGGANFKSVQERFEMIGRTNQIFEAILYPSNSERQESRGTFFPPSAPEGGDSNMLPEVWTCSEAVRRALMEQIGHSKAIGMELKRMFNQTSAAASTVNSAIITASSIREQLDFLVTQLVNMAQVLLGDYSFQLLLLGEAVDAGIEGSVGAREQLDNRFDEIRRQTIQFFSDLEQYDLALHLAEQYGDFNTLVKTCDSTGDDRRLRQYMQTHGVSFAFFLFSWYEANLKFEKLLQQPREMWDLLSEHLANKPSLLWLHQTTMGNWLGAAQTLEKLGLHERESFEARHRHLSMAKLNYQVSGTAGDNSAVLDDYLLMCRIQARLVDMFRNDSVRQPTPSSQNSDGIFSLILFSFAALIRSSRSQEPRYLHCGAPPLGYHFFH